MSLLVRDNFAPTIPGFELIVRYFDPQQARVLAKILPGEYYVTNSPEELIVTTLGSCISVCIRDIKALVGGMNHFMLPGIPNHPGQPSTAADRSNCYGAFAVENLVNTILKCGGKKRYFEVKVTGGGRIGTYPGSVSDSNIRFIQEYLKMEGLHPVATDLGGLNPRKVRYDPLSGRLQVKKLARVQSKEALEKEICYRRSIAAAIPAGSVELFSESRDAKD